MILQNITETETWVTEKTPHGPEIMTEIVSTLYDNWTSYVKLMVWPTFWSGDVMYDIISEKHITCLSHDLRMQGTPYPYRHTQQLKLCTLNNRIYRSITHGLRYRPFGSLMNRLPNTTLLNGNWLVSRLCEGYCYGGIQNGGDCWL